MKENVVSGFPPKPHVVPLAQCPFGPQIARPIVGSGGGSPSTLTDVDAPKVYTNGLEAKAVGSGV